MRVRQSLILSALVCSLCTSTLWADTIAVAVENHSFEKVTCVDGGGEYFIPDWTISGKAGTWNVKDYYSGNAPDGQNVAFVVAYIGWPATTSTISQVLSTKLSLNTLYTLQVEVGKSNGTDPTAPYRVQLWAGGVLLSEDNNSLTLDRHTTFQTSTVTYSALSNDSQLDSFLEIRFIVECDSSRPYGDYSFDNVRLDATPSAVPTPSSFIALLGMGAMGLVAVARRRRNQA